ncbi:hypothetical protein [Streptomyces sp. NPDC056227]|uniref:hypothetical protein n=1 Tax=Streptomyces sp. NPDC056227 TaxID=3345753 RepID=UPI0035E21052
MADSLSDDDVLEAVARHTGRPGQGAQIRREGADITPVPMLGLTIDRSTETRTTKPVRRGGRPDLSYLPEYEGDLRDCPVDPPTDPGRSKTVEFVLRGSVRTAPCICVGGRILCKRCLTRGTLRCETGVALNLPEPPPPLRVRRMTALGGAWERVTLTEAGAPLPDGLDPSHLKAVESALAPRRDEVSRRAEFRLLRPAQVVLRDDQDHVFYVFPGRNGPEVCSVWSRRRILRAVGVAAATAVLLVLGLALLG